MFAKTRGFLLDSNKISKSKVEGFTADITPLLEQSKALSAEKNRLEQSVDTIKETKSKTLTKEEFLLYLGKNTTSNGVKLLTFNDFDTEEKGAFIKPNSILSFKAVPQVSTAFYLPLTEWT